MRKQVQLETFPDEPDTKKTNSRMLVAKDIAPRSQSPLRFELHLVHQGAMKCDHGLRIIVTQLRFAVNCRRKHRKRVSIEASHSAAARRVRARALSR